MRILLAAALAALAACNQPAEEAAAPEAPPSIQAQVRAMTPEMQPVFATTELQAHLQTQGQSCEVRGAEPRGTVPANVAPDSIYAPFAGADTYTVQCGERLTTVGADPRQRWLVVFPADSETAQFVNCADESGADRCAARQIPTAEAAPAATP